MTLMVTQTSASAASRQRVVTTVWPVAECGGHNPVRSAGF